MPRKKVTTKKKTTKKQEEEQQPEVYEPAYEQGGSGGLGILIAIIAILIIGGAGFGYWQFTQRSAEPEVMGQQDEVVTETPDFDDPQTLIDAVSKHILLPEGEPTIATVENAEALKESQVFFAEAQNGDKLLIYADRAIIYNIEKDVVVNVGPVFMDESAKLATEEGITVEIRNGSGITGAAKTLGDNLTDVGFEVVGAKDAANTNYQGVIIVNLGEKDLTNLADSLKAEIVSELPKGEKPSEADVVIIIGQLEQEAE